MGARSRLAEYLLAGQREGLVDKKLDIAWAAEWLHECLLGCIINFLALSQPASEISKHQAKLRKILQIIKAS